jgi:L-lactate dehydrogenase complex protein LldG
MNSRDKILGTVKNNQPPLRELPPLPEGGTLQGPVDPSRGADADLSAAFMKILEGIGGQGFLVSGYNRIVAILREQHPDARRIVSGCTELVGFAEVAGHYDDPHALENVDLAILKAHFGVAENGACWMTEDQMIERALPFITQHLALILRRDAMVADMHAAYERIAELEATRPTGYGFATFIAGPSKTADIEQSLVLGAHGPRSLIVFLLDEGVSDAGFY